MQKFEGEHLLPGQLGHFFVILALVSSLIAMISFFNASRTQNNFLKNQWMKFAKINFAIQAFSILFIFCTVFYICYNHYYEYMYAYKHASKELETKFLLACIWEGQEGSFLLWSIWHALIGIAILSIKKEEYKTTWQAPVLTIISLAQCCLMLMILGIYFFDVREFKGGFVFHGRMIAGAMEVPAGSSGKHSNFRKI